MKDMCQRSSSGTVTTRRFSELIEVQWVRINIGCTTLPSIRCRVVAHKAVYGVNYNDYLYTGTLSLVNMQRMLSWHASSGSVVFYTVSREDSFILNYSV